MGELSVNKALFFRSLASYVGEEFLQDYDDLVRLMKPRQYKKNQILHRAGDRSKSIFFMASGLVRCFYILNDKEVNLRLLCDNSVVVELSSVVTGEPSDQTLECIDDCEGFELSEANYYRLSESVAFLKLEKIILQRHYLSMERRLRMLQHKSLVQRYTYFMNMMEPKIVNNMPAIHIASYLGVSPESLSRIKSQLNKC